MYRQEKYTGNGYHFVKCHDKWYLIKNHSQYATDKCNYYERQQGISFPVQSFALHDCVDYAENQKQERCHFMNDNSCKWHHDCDNETRKK